MKKSMNMHTNAFDKASLSSQMWGGIVEQALRTLLQVEPVQYFGLDIGAQCKKWVGTLAPIRST